MYVSKEASKGSLFFYSFLSAQYLESIAIKQAAEDRSIKFFRRLQGRAQCQMETCFHMLC